MSAKGKRRLPTTMFTIRDPGNPNLLLHVEPVSATGVGGGGQSPAQPPVQHGTPATRTAVPGSVPFAANNDEGEDESQAAESPAQWTSAKRSLLPQMQPPPPPPPPLPDNAAGPLVAYCQSRLMTIVKPLILFAAEMRTKLGESDDRKLLNFNFPPVFFPAEAASMTKTAFATLYGGRIGPKVMQALIAEYEEVQLPVLQGTTQAPDMNYYAFLQACTEVEQWPNLCETCVYPLVLSSSFYGALRAACTRINALSPLAAAAETPIELHQLIASASSNGSSVLTMFQGMVATHMLEGPGFNVYAIGKMGNVNRYAMSVGIKTREHRARLMDAYDIWFKTVYRISGKHPRATELRALLAACTFLQPDEENAGKARVAHLEKTAVTLVRDVVQQQK